MFNKISILLNAIKEPKYHGVEINHIIVVRANPECQALWLRVTQTKELARVECRQNIATTTATKKKKKTRRIRARDRCECKRANARAYGQR